MQPTNGSLQATTCAPAMAMPAPLPVGCACAVSASVAAAAPHTGKDVIVVCAVHEGKMCSRRHDGLCTCQPFPVRWPWCVAPHNCRAARGAAGAMRGVSRAVFGEAAGLAVLAWMSMPPSYGAR